MLETNNEHGYRDRYGLRCNKNLWNQVARDKFNESISNKFADYYSKDSALREDIARWMGQNTAPARATLKKLIDDPKTPDYEREIINNYLKLTSGNN